MSDFLTRLVQRTRGELSMVRPVAHAITAPDPDALAWDEQVVARDAPPLARPLRGPAAPAAEPSLVQRMAATAAPVVVAAPPAPALRGPPAPAAAALDPAPPADAARPERTTSLHLEHATLSRERAPDLALAPAPAPAAPSPAVGGPRLDPARIDDSPAPAVAAARSPWSIAREAVVAHAGRPPRAGAVAPGSRPPGIPVSFPATTLAPALERAPTAAPAADDPGTAAGIVEVGDAPMSIRGTPARAATALALPPLAYADPSAAAEVRLIPRDGAERPPLVEQSTTVEVSIGRIEVRLPTQPRPPAPATPPSSRRPVMPLAEYLRDRDAGKVR